MANNSELDLAALRALLDEMASKGAEALAKASGLAMDKASPRLRAAFTSDAKSVLEAAGVPALLDRIEAAEKETVELSAEMKAMVESHAQYVAGKVTLNELVARNGRMDMVLGTEMASIMGDSLAQMLAGNEAENYVEVTMRGSDGKLYTLRVQRHEKPTPHDFRVIAERARDEARAETSALLAEVERLRAPVSSSSETEYCLVWARKGKNGRRYLVVNENGALFPATYREDQRFLDAIRAHGLTEWETIHHNTDKSEWKWHRPMVKVNTTPHPGGG